MAVDVQQLYARSRQAALDLLHTELTALQIFLRLAREATASGDLERAARNRALAASAVHGARKIVHSEADALRRVASHQAARGDWVCAASLEGYATELDHELGELIDALARGEPLDSTPSSNTD